jgi:hypothetical protein
MLFRGKIAVYCENRTKHTNTYVGRMQSFIMLKQVIYIYTYIYIITTGYDYENIKKRDSECVNVVKVAQDRMTCKDFCDYCDESESSTKKANVFTSRVSSHTKEDYGQQILRVSLLVS